MSTVTLHDPQTLYRHWEESQCRTFALDGLRRRLNLVGVPLDTL
jgi:hypothetical protein